MTRPKRETSLAYRQLWEDFWESPEWVTLPPDPPSPRALLLFLAVGPLQRSVPGVVFAGVGQLADRLGWQAQDVRDCLAQLERAGSLRVDLDARLIWLPWRYQHEPPANPSVIRGQGWRAVFERWPRGALAVDVYEFLRVRVAARGAAFAQAFKTLPLPPQYIELTTAPFLDDPTVPDTVPPTVPDTVSPHGVGDGDGGGGGTSENQRIKESENQKAEKHLSTSSTVALQLVKPEPEQPTLPTGPTDVEKVEAYYRRAMKKSAAWLFDSKREKAVRGRLKQGYSVEQLCKAIDGCAKSPHHRGDNDRGTPYNDLELICRDAVHVDQFIAIAEGAPAHAAQGRRGAWVPLTGTKERFEGLEDDGDALGLHFKPKEAPRG